MKNLLLHAFRRLICLPVLVFLLGFQANAQSDNPNDYSMIAGGKMRIMGDSITGDTLKIGYAAAFGDSLFGSISNSDTTLYSASPHLPTILANLNSALAAEFADTIGNVLPNHLTQDTVLAPGRYYVNGNFRISAHLFAADSLTDSIIVVVDGILSLDSGATLQSESISGNRNLVVYARSLDAGQAGLEATIHVQDSASLNFAYGYLALRSVGKVNIIQSESRDLFALLKVPRPPDNCEPTEDCLISSNREFSDLNVVGCPRLAHDGLITYACGWNPYDQGVDVNLRPFGSADLFGNCSPTTDSWSLGTYIFSDRSTHQGRGPDLFFGAVSLWSDATSTGTGSSHAEYLYQKIPTLFPGRQYYATFDALKSKLGTGITDQLGIYFRTLRRMPLPGDAGLLIKETPQVSNPTGRWISSQNVWVTVSDKFSVTSNCDYMFIGSFRSTDDIPESHRPPYVGSSPPIINPAFLYGINNAFVFELPAPGDDKEIGCLHASSADIGVGCLPEMLCNNAGKKRFQIRWTWDGGTSSTITDEPTLNVMPTGTTTYTMEMVDNGYQDFDQVSSTLVFTPKYINLGSVTVTVTSELWGRVTPTACSTDDAYFELTVADPMAGGPVESLEVGTWTGDPFNTDPMFNSYAIANFPSDAFFGAEGYLNFQRVYTNGCVVKGTALILGQNLVQNDEFRTDFAYEDLDIFVLDDISLILDAHSSNILKGSTIVYVVGAGSYFHPGIDNCRPGGEVTKSQIRTHYTSLELWDQVVFKPVCSFMWKGIGVDEKSGLNTTKCNRCQIIGAERGIFIADFTVSDVPYEILMSNIDFKNCYKGVELYAAGAGFDQDLVIDNCTFTAEVENMPRPFDKDWADNHMSGDCGEDPDYYYFKTQVGIDVLELNKLVNHAVISNNTFDGVCLAVRLNTTHDFDVQGSQVELTGPMAAGYYFQDCQDLAVTAFYELPSYTPHRTEMHYNDDLSNYADNYQADHLHNTFAGGLHHQPPAGIAGYNCEDLQIGTVHFNAAYNVGVDPAIGGYGVTLKDCPGTFFWENYLERLDVGIRLLGDFTSAFFGDLYLLEGNTFDNCITGLNIDASSADDDLLNMHCNEFIAFDDESISRTGILVDALPGPGRSEIGYVTPSTIGGQTYYPGLGGNLFPPKGGTGLPSDHDVQAHWTPLTNFQSIVNNGGYNLYYHRYVNEFVGTLNPTSGSNSISVPYPDVDYLAYTSANSSTPQSLMPALDGPASPLCDNFGSSEVIYPTAKARDDKNATALDAVSTHGVSLYPNPADRSFVVRMEDGQSEPMQIELIGMTGKCERTFKNVNSETMLDVRGLPSGLYTVQVKNRHLAYTLKLSILGSD